MSTTYPVSEQTTPQSVSRGVNSNNSIARSNNVVESSTSRSASRPTVSREVAASVSARSLEFEVIPTEVDQIDTPNDNDMQIADTNDTTTQRDDDSDMVAASSSCAAAPPIRHSVTDETKRGNNNMESEDEEMEVVNNSNTTAAQSTLTGQSTHSDMDDEMEDDLFGQVESRATESNAHDVQTESTLSTQAPLSNTQDMTQIEQEIDHSTVFEGPEVDMVRPAVGLPHGWTTKTYHRKTGKTAGRAYHMYYSPKKNKKFPSMVQAKEYIKILSQPDVVGDEDRAWKVFQAKRETMKAERKALKQEAAAAASAQLTNNEPAVELPLPNLDQNMNASHSQETRGLLESTQTFQPSVVQQTQQSVREPSAYVAPLGAEIILAKASDRVGAKEDQAILISEVQDYLTCSDSDLVSIQWLSTREVVEIPKSWTRPCPERRSASNKPLSYEDLDDDKISSMMSTDDADAIEKAAKAKAASKKAKKKKMRKKKMNNLSYLLVVEERGSMFYHKKKMGKGKFIIEGHWVIEDRPSHPCQRFKLVHTLAEGKPPAVLPKEAIFHGSFEGKGKEKDVLMVEERDVHLSFTEVDGDPNLLAVKGRGKNLTGTYKISGSAMKITDGTYDAGKYKVALLKKYTKLRDTMPSKKSDDAANTSAVPELTDERADI